ncbi:hypothetical protein CLIB1444_09S03708 [[Candida] jaroonii]|uniref:Uncharacterized protein n=1 Tax=[Candida] jaroonii TaxID=467808 RepID=A0ACA9YCM1_9ASCO|nr:hypothetical protein CLIB1444_09S03708 [[Candida] jaroonii]
MYSYSPVESDLRDGNESRTISIRNNNRRNDPNGTHLVSISYARGYDNDNDNEITARGGVQYSDNFAIDSDFGGMDSTDDNDNDDNDNDNEIGNEDDVSFEERDESITTGLNRINLISHFFHETQSGLGRYHSDITNDDLPSEIRNISYQPLRLRRSNAIRRVPQRINNYHLSQINNDEDLTRNEAEEFGNYPQFEINKVLKEFMNCYKKISFEENPIFGCFKEHVFSKWNNYDLDHKLNKYLKMTNKGDIFKNEVTKRKQVDKGNNKRRKIGPKSKEVVRERKEEEKGDEEGEEETIVHHDHQREKLFKLKFSSYFKRGSSYDYDYLNIIVHQIDYKTRKLYLKMSILPTSEDFVTNFEDFYKAIMPTTYKSEKTKLLEKLFDEARNNPKAEAIFKKRGMGFLIPGEMIDFKNNDLRYMSKEFHEFKNLHLVKITNSDIKLQILKWFKIPPFHDLKKIIFLKFLKFILAQDIPNLNKYLSLLGFLDNYNLTTLNLTPQQFEIITKLRSISQKLNQVKLYSRIDYYKKIWQSKITNHFIHFLTCEKNCIINLLLNYNLFHLSIATDKFLEQSINQFLQFLPKTKLKYEFEELKTKSLKEDKPISLIGSLNRKNGDLNIASTGMLIDNSTNLIKAEFTRRNKNVYNTGGGDQVFEFT